MDFSSLGFTGGALNGWIIWILPFIGALVIPAAAKISKNSSGYVAVAFALASAVSAATLLPLALHNQEIHNQIPWISSIGLKAGILADPLAILMTNIVAWISFLIFVYSLGYMKGDRDLMRFFFWMSFFIGSMQLIVLSDNFLQLFFGWEGVGLASYALVGFWYRDRRKITWEQRDALFLDC
jgi:NADH-quinone oxidoreductase subunit L